MLQNFTDLLPLIDHNPADEIVFYSQNGTGVGGRFVVLETGFQDPAVDGAGTYGSTTPGYDYQGVTNVRYENKRKFKLAPGGVNKASVLGITLYGTAEYDQNGQKLLFLPNRKTELGVVTSGETSNVLTDGLIRLKASAYSGTPIPGYVGLISTAGNGTIQIFDPATLPATGLASASNAVVKVLSTSGSAFGGYADFKLMLK
jgi:hypothetical protein